LWVSRGGLVSFFKRQKEPEQLLQPAELPTIRPVSNNVPQYASALW
jgi:hypothetical protein